MTNTRNHPQDKSIEQNALSSPDVITFGESMALLMPIGTKGIEYSTQLEKSFAGAESNFAIGVARLGHRSGWFGRLGADPLGRDILKQIRGEGVDVSRAKLREMHQQGLLFEKWFRASRPFITIVGSPLQVGWSRIILMSYISPKRVIYT